MLSSPDKTVLITGCSSGIGPVSPGDYNSAATGYSPRPGVLSSVAELSEEGLESLHLDLDDSISIKQAVDDVLRRTDGRLYAVFNNGAFGLPGAIEDLSR